MLAKIGELLTEDDLITQDQLDHCLEYKKMNPKDRLGSILKHHGFINDHELADLFIKTNRIGNSLKVNISLITGPLNRWG